MLLCYTQTMKAKPSIEPGILPLLRVFVLLQMVLMGWNWLRSLQGERLAFEERFPRLAEWVVGRKVNSEIYLIWFALLLGFLIFLLLPQIPKWLGRVFLPIALTIQVAILVAGNDLVALARATGEAGLDYGVRNSQIFIFLAVPILLASWQFTFWGVLALILFSSALDLLGILLLPPTSTSISSMLILTLGLRTTLYGLIGYTITRLMKEQRRLRSSLETANQKLSNHMSTLDALATARERNRLARDLHDTLAHSLSGLIIQLEAINILWGKQPEQAKHDLQNSTMQARAGLQEARRAIKALRAAPLEEMGLLVALEQAAKEAAARGAFQVTTDLPKNFAALAPEIENDIYRVTLEAFENIVRHAQAEHAALCLEEKNGELHLQITDDGLGFSPENIKDDSRFGLIGLRERAMLQGATLHIESQEGKGTKISFQMELRP
jgi:signal transduction histidine kinase